MGTAYVVMAVVVVLIAAALLFGFYRMDQRSKGKLTDKELNQFLANPMGFKKKDIR